MQDEIIGYRVIEDTPVVGQQLDRSYVWAGDEITSEQLQGTCAFETLAMAREYGRYSRGFWIVGLTGERVMAGELRGEVIVRDAVVAVIVGQIP